ncbi:MAG TPA: acyl carrier protein [Verrucomicrobiales bacterium]|nr:acyl carrier protein [Verrucomicrobiales bacterium]
MERQILDYLRGDLLAGEALDELTAETDLFQLGVLESVRVMRLVAWLEKTFEFQARPADLVPEHFRTVAAIGSYLRSRGKAA